MALLTLEELQTDLGRTSRPFSADEEGTAQFLIDRITEYITSRCAGISFEVHTNVTEKMQADYAGIIEIRKYPVIDVTNVVDAKYPNQAMYWDWDEFDSIFDLFPHQVVLVTYSYGYSTPPDDIKIVARSLAFQGFSNPFGIRQQTVGAISETYSPAAALSPQDDAILAKYEPYGSSLRLGRFTGGRGRGIPAVNAPWFEG